MFSLNFAHSMSSESKYYTGPCWCLLEDILRIKRMAYKNNVYSSYDVYIWQFVLLCLVIIVIHIYVSCQNLTCLSCEVYK